MKMKDGTHAIRCSSIEQKEKLLKDNSELTKAVNRLLNQFPEFIELKEYRTTIEN